MPRTLLNELQWVSFLILTIVFTNIVNILLRSRNFINWLSIENYLYAYMQNNSNILDM